MADMSIQSAYERVLGRTPSADEVAYWQSTFGNSVDPVELSTFSVAAQPELAAAAPTNTAVRDMYQQVLGRAPDASGLQYFAERFGTSIDPTELGIFQSMAAEEVAANAARNAAQQAAAAANTTTTTDDSAGIQVVVFGPDGTPYGSPAAAARAGVTNYTMENPATTAATTAATGMSIEDAYQRVLGRAPSASEIAYWTSQFGSDVDPTELSTFSVAAQPERAAAPTTNDAIRQMYLSVLGREPDASGLQYFADRFGTEVDASELGIFKGMATQEINANAARNAGTTTGTGTTAGTTTGTGTTAGTTTGTGTAGTVQPITRPTAQRQVTGTQLAPARVTNTAITGTPFRNIYTPSTMQQNAPTLAQINAASQSANPYQSLMALTPQRTLSPAYAAQAGLTAANTNLGGFNPAVYNPAATRATTGGGLLTTAESPAGGENPAATTPDWGTALSIGQTLSDLGLTSIGDSLQADARMGINSQTGAYSAEAQAQRAAEAAAMAAQTANAAGVNTSNLSEAEAAFQGRPGGGTVDQGDPNPSDPIGGSAGAESGNYGGNYGGSGSGYMAKGGMVTPRQVKGRNPPGPDDGYTGLDIGEYVIRKKAVQKYGANIFEQINAGKIPAKRLKSLLE
jgi:hypothetical protein